jgi:hypothetical protein
MCFHLLLVVAIILKKREANKDAEPSKKPTAVKAKAKPVSTSSSEVIEPTPTTTKPTPSSGIKETTQLAPELRRHIENQMRDGNYFAAEAQINQALNRDNSQHELYLMLLDLHLLQNDEFAINQLFTHLRSLQLEDILAEAQEKRTTHEQGLAADAQAKAQAQAAQLAASSVSFDQLQEQVTHKAPAPLEFSQPASQAALTPVAPQSEVVKPLEFSFSEPQSSPKTEAQPLEFNTASAATPEPKAEKSLDFAFNLEQPATAPTPVETPANNSLDFSFTPTAEAATPLAKAPLEFDLEQKAAPVKQELEFNLDLPQTPSIEAAPKAELEFNLDQPSTAQATLEFNLAPETPAPAVTQATPQVNTQDFEFKIEPQPDTAAAPVAKAASKPDANDPLLQIFPALGQINEADLNLRLAAEYIRLGAYQDAQSILAEQDPHYTSQQRQTANELKNKIA